MCFWEILVPYQTNEGKKIDVKYHREWDSKIRAISGGLTILRPMRGQWLFNNRFYDEKVIPCRILATKEEIDVIIEITLKHYKDQHCVMAYKISSEVIVKYR